MGLGLAASSLICKALGGELHLIRSEENEGTKFEFTMRIDLGNPIDVSKSEGEGFGNSIDNGRTKSAFPNGSTY